MGKLSLLILLIVALLTLYPVLSYAQRDSVRNLSRDVDTTFRVPLDSLVLLRFGASTETGAFRFKNINKGRDFNIAPNNAVKLTLSARYKSLGLSYAYSPYQPDRNAKGKTSYNAIGLDLVIDSKWSFFYNYETAKGYFLENSLQYRNELTNSNLTYAVFPGITSSIFRGENYYYFNGAKFSADLPDEEYEIQKRSAGSVVVPLNFYYSKLDITKERFQDLSIQSGLIYPNYLTDFYVLSGVGYSYNWVLNKGLVLNIRTIPVAGFDVNHTRYSNLSATNKNVFSYGYQANAVLAHVSTKWVYGLSTQSLRWKSLALSNDVIGKHDFFEVFVGHCLGVPKFLKKPLDSIDKIL